MHQFKKVLAPIIILFLLSCPTPAQDNHEEAAADWARINTPGEAHRKLDIFAGTWNTTTKIWMGGPDQPPSVSKGKSSVEWILDGRFLEEKSESVMSFPGPDGKMMEVPYAGRGLQGHDNVRNLYVSTWADSLSTSISSCKGQFSSDGKTLTMYGEMDEPAIKVYGRTVRIQIVLESDDRHVFTMYDLHAGEDYKVMEILYERI